MGGSNGISSMEKKRIRDRRAQQKHRERKDLYTKQLEDQVAFCQHNHEPANIRSLMEKIGQLEAVNDTLLREKDRLLELANHFQKSVTALCSIDQHHRQGNVRKDTRKSLLSSIARPVDRTSQSDVDVIPSCDSTSIPDGTDMIAMRSQISLPPEQLPSTRSNDDDASIVESADIRSAVIPASAETEAPITNGRQPLSPYPSNSPSPTPVIRDYCAIGISSRKQAHIQNVDEGFSPAGINYRSQAALSEGSIIAGTRSTEQAGTETTALSTSSDPPEMRLGPNGPSDENTAASIPTANIRWLLLPSNTVPYEPRKLDCHWLNFPHAVADAPDVPQPEDLLFGSRKNLLANGIHKALRTARVAEPERLAMGWLLYIFSRWRIIPTRENFAKIPHFLRPTPEQISQPHPARVDMLPWPSLRLALMNYHSDAQLDETLELLACCVKLRWPWGREFLRMRDDGCRELVDEFLNTLMSLDGWGVTREFAVAYPHLIEGLNLHIIEYNVA